MSAASLSTARQAAMMEYSSMSLPTHCPLGMYCTPNPSNILEWSVVLFLHRGYYSTSILPFLILLPASYPSSIPSVKFQIEIFHPLVDPSTGLMSLSPRFPGGRWREGQDFIFHVLHFVKGAFKREGLDALREEVCLNREAYRLYRDQTPLFTKLAAQSAALSRAGSALFGNASGSLIVFRKLEKGEEEELKKKVEQAGRAKLVDPFKMVGL